MVELDWIGLDWIGLDWISYLVVGMREVRYFFVVLGDGGRIGLDWVVVGSRKGRKRGMGFETV